MNFKIFIIDENNIFLELKCILKKLLIKLLIHARILWD